MKKKSPSVAVMISTYNWKEALRICLRGVLDQTVLPDEIVIADDGSRPDTAAFIREMQRVSPVPIVHVWHEDAGFRRTIILNKAIALVKSDYILQIDGDVVPARHFVADHLELAEPGYFVCGSRVKLTKEATEKIFSGGRLRPCFFSLPLGYALNTLRSRLLRSYLAGRYARSIDHLRGCNMAFWRSDLLRVNGYNEDLLEWGHEDGELAFRLHFAGVGKKALKMGGAVFHLYHKEASRGNEQRHIDELEHVKSNRIAWCKNGIDKYLSLQS